MTDGTVHVVPVNDQVAHELTDECVCGPGCLIVDRDDGSVGVVVKHSSLDGRELAES